jgi:hypothetical protein
MRKNRKTVLRNGVVSWILLIMLLSPMVLKAGDLDPAGPPAPTMKTLDQIPPTWSQTIPGAERFVPVLSNGALLDKETGLVWEKTPSSTTYTWEGAVDICASKTIGNRRGWQLPSVQQLSSLVDRSQTNPSLPSGHPFPSTQLTSTFWSSSTLAINSGLAWGVSFYEGVLLGTPKDATYYVRCVRGGPTHNAY